MSETERFKQIIEVAAQDAGFPIKEWSEEDGRPVASLGRFVARYDDDDEMYFEGDEGEIAVTVVGAAQYDNERPYFTFKPDGYSEGEEVRYGDISGFDAI